METRNILNDCETFLVAWLKADADLDVASGSILEKFRETKKATKAAALPSIEIYCNELATDDDDLLVSGMAFITASGVESSSDTEAKKIMAQMFVSLDKQFVPGYNKSDYVIGMQCDNGVVMPIPSDNNRYCSVAQVNFSIGIKRDFRSTFAAEE